MFRHRPQFQKLKDARLKSTRVLFRSRQVWGQERTLVITFSPELQRKQIRGIEQHLSKKRRALEELHAKLRRSQNPGAKGKGYSRESLAKQVRQICAGQHISKILHVVIEKRDRKSTRLNSSHPSISYAVFCLKKKKITE